jgi:hypothetical protein
MTFCWVLQCLTNMATGEDDMRFKTAIISFGLTACGAWDSSVTSTARLEYQDVPDNVDRV